ncbi:hypothetical protein IWQ60_008065 [Tieghemiomyces parasiticus]|uniref:Homeobox domain-containing protein n=1 Tax=Tieghemiomyces parasiticus TaxID=78921 RepID=A0A9W8DMH1_9FUNG|nr:hypothetical protein IWQ60_008065 [Tieghemiomyces parasiticus]
MEEGWLPYVFSTKNDVLGIEPSHPIFNQPAPPRPQLDPQFPAPYLNLPPPSPYYEFDQPPLPPYKQVKKRKRLTPEKLTILLGVFQKEQKPNAEKRKQLSEQTGMTPREVQVWFQNRRAKMKRERAAEDKRSPMGTSLSARSSPHPPTENELTPLTINVYGPPESHYAHGTSTSSAPLHVDTGAWARPVYTVPSTGFGGFQSESPVSAPTPMSSSSFPYVHLQVGHGNDLVSPSQSSPVLSDGTHGSQPPLNYLNGFVPSTPFSVEHMNRSTNQFDPPASPLPNFGVFYRPS